MDTWYSWVKTRLSYMKDGKIDNNKISTRIRNSLFVN